MTPLDNRQRREDRAGGEIGAEPIPGRRPMAKKATGGSNGVALKSLDQLRPADYNPRKITSDAFKGLKASLAAFGDISGIVWNRRSGNLVAGHQRLSGLKEAHGEALAIRTARGEARLHLPDGSSFAIRVVDWDEGKEKAANVAANNPHIMGDFTDALIPLLEESRVHDSALFDELHLGALGATMPSLDPAGEEEQGNLDQTKGVTGERAKCPECGHEFKP